MSSGEYPKDDEVPFNSAELLNSTVQCRTCGDVYTCTPSNDYYNSGGITNNDGIYVDGACEGCFLSGAGLASEEIIVKAWQPPHGIIFPNDLN